MAATHPFGGRLQRSSNGSSYTNVATVRSITPPSVKIGTSDATHLTSTNAFKEKNPGWGDGGDCKFKLIFDKSEYDTLYGLLRSTHYWKVLLPLIGAEANNTNWVFQGHITEIAVDEFSATSDDPIMADVTVDITGKPTYVAGT